MRWLTRAFFGGNSDDDDDDDDEYYYSDERKYPEESHLRMYEEQPRVIPAGNYVIVARVVEAKDVCAIKTFDLWQTITSFSLKAATENADALPNVTTKVKLSRAGFPTQKRKTAVEKETSQPLWNQCFYFEGMELARGELDGCTVNFEVSDARKFGKDATIGCVEIECSKVYDEEDGREVWQRWYHLTDPTGKRQGSQGQVKICVKVLRRGDEDSAISHMDEVSSSEDEGNENDDNDDKDDKDDRAKNKLAKKSFLASLMQKETDTPAEEGEIEIWAIKANVYTGKDLPRMDWPNLGGAGIDAYVKLSCGSSAVPAKSKVRRSKNPEWNQEIIMRARMAGGKFGGVGALPPLRLSVMDYDLAGADDHVASTSILIRDIIAQPKDFARPKWYCFYGGTRNLESSFRGHVSKLAKRMNAGYLEGSAYRGRVLMSFTATREETGKSTGRAKTRIPKVSDKLSREWPCILHTEVLDVELFQTNAKGKKCHVEVEMGLSKRASPKSTLMSEQDPLVKECYAEINSALAPLQVNLPMPFDGPRAGEGAPDVFVRVCVAGKSIGFARIPAKRLTPVDETMGPLQPPDEEKVPNGWNVQGWFQLQADALSNHKIGQSRSLEHVKPVGQVLIRMILRGNPNLKRQAKNDANEGADEDGDDEALALKEELKNVDPADKKQKEELEKRRKKMERKMKGAVDEMIAKPLKPMEKRKFMLHVEAYQAVNLPAADPNGASDPVAVVRCGRAVIQTQTMKSTVSPSWFRDLFVEIELPLLPPTAIDPTRTDSDSDSDSESDSDSDDDSSSNEDKLESKLLDKRMKEFRKLNKNKSGGGGGKLQGLSGIAWWAAPAITILVFDEDKATLLSGADIDPLSVLMVPLLHPSEMRAKNAGSLAAYSGLASSVSFFSDFSLDPKRPERYDEVLERVNNEVDDKHPYPEWYEMVKLNPNSSDLSANGGELLMHYEVLPLPFMGVANFVLGPQIKVQWENVKPRPEHLATRQVKDYFGFEAVEVSVCVMGVRGLLPYKQFAAHMPKVEFELTGCIPLFDGSMEHVKSTAFRNLPNGPNANFNGQTLTLRGLVPKLTKIYTSLAIRVIDARPVKRLIGTAEHQVFLRRDELALLEKKGSNLVSVKRKETTPDEREKLLEILRDETISDYSFDIDDGTATLVSQSNTVTDESLDHIATVREEVLQERLRHIDEARSSPGKSVISKLLGSVGGAADPPAASARQHFDIESGYGGTNRTNPTMSTKHKRKALSRSMSQRYEDELNMNSAHGKESTSVGKSLREIRKARKASFKNRKEAIRQQRQLMRDGVDSYKSQSQYINAKHEIEDMMSRFTKSKSKRMKTLTEGREYGESSSSDAHSSDADTLDGSGAITDSDPESVDGGMNAVDENELNRRLQEEREKLAEGEAALAHEAKANNEDDEEANPPSKKQKKIITFDDGSGNIPEWMNDRMLLPIGTLEEELGDVAMTNIPIYRAEGFEDNSSKREVGGYVKFCYSVSEMNRKYFATAEEEYEYIHGPPEPLKLDFLGNPKKDKPAVAAKKARNAAIMQNTLWTPDKTTATISEDEFLKIQKQAGGYVNANQPMMGEQPRPVTVRAYVIRGKGLRPIDQSGLCDPYLVVSVPGTDIKFGNSKDRINRTCTPWFYKTFEYKTDLPGNGLLKFDVFDYEKYSSDAFLGQCLVDVEARLLSDRWSTEMSDKPPLEIRQLLDKLGNPGFGELEIIVEIHDGHDNIPKALVIQPPPVVEVEMRVCVFKARNMVNKDVGGKNDLYFKLSLVGLDRTSTRFSETQSTDIHWFARDGVGSFNYRNIFHLTLPCNRINLRVSAYDKDLISGDDNIGENKIPLSKMCKELVRNVSTFGEMSPECVIQHKYDANEEPFSLNPFKNMMEGPMQGKWLKMYHPTLPGESQGEVEIMITLLPRKQAEERPVGKARELPNRDPELKEPDRAHLSLLNPLGSLALIMGPDMAKKIVFVILILGSLYMFVMSAFFIINDIIDAEITATINEKRAMEQEMEIERENLITGAEAYAKHAIGLDTLEEEVHKKLNETETKILDTTGLSTVLKKYNEVKSEIDHYSNAARDATVSTTVPPTTATATPNTTAGTTVAAPVPAATTVAAPVPTTTTVAAPVPATTTVAVPTTASATAATPAVATTNEAVVATPAATEEVAAVPSTEVPSADEEEAAPSPVTEAYMGHHRYDFEDEQDRLNQSTDGDELDEWFSKYSMLGNARERAQKLAELGKRRDAEQPPKIYQKLHRKLLPNPLEN